MKIVIYDLLYKSNQFDVFYIFAILSVWPNLFEEASHSSSPPEELSHPNSSTDSFNPILQKTMENIIFFHYQKLNVFENCESNSFDFIEKMISLFKNLKNSSFEEFIEENLISILTGDKIKKLIQKKTQVYEFYKSFQLLPIYKEWEWVYNNLICLKLATFMVPTVDEDILMFVIKLMGFLGKSALHSSGSATLPGCDQLRARLRFILLSNSPCN